MRRPRIKSPGEGFYHVVSRISGRRFLMDDGEKGILLGMVRAAAAFSGVEVYTYALMDNHFHLLLRVPQREEVDDAELSRRVRALYGPERSGRLFAQWGQWLSAGDAVRVEEARGEKGPDPKSGHRGKGAGKRGQTPNQGTKTLD